MRRFLSGVALLALAGCHVPHHVMDKPVIENPATQGAFREGDAGVSRDDLPARWWHLYDDPVLDMLEEQALAANTSLRVAQASLMRAKAATAAAEGQHEPDFTTAFGVQRARLSGESYLLNTTIRWPRWIPPRRACLIRSTCSGGSSTASRRQGPMRRRRRPPSARSR
jgi:outer membrane protein TolC